MRESLRWKETLKGKKTTEVDSETCAPGNRRKCARFHRRYHGDSVGDDSLEFLGRHAGMCGRDDLQARLLASGHDRRQVALKDAFEWRCGFPLGMVRCHGFDAIDRKGQLDVHRLLAPERAVVVERRNALFQHVAIDRICETRPVRRWTDRVRIASDD